MGLWLIVWVEVYWRFGLYIKVSYKNEVGNSIKGIIRNKKSINKVLNYSMWDDSNVYRGLD